MEAGNKKNHYYISLPCQKPEEGFVDFEMKMLEQNEIRGLLSASREYQDAEVKLYFDISGRQNLEQRYAWQKISGKELRQILEAIAAVAGELEEYLLDYNHLNLMPEYIYGTLDLKDICFCYEPWDSETFGGRLKSLSLWFLDHMDYREREEVIFSYEFQRFCDENDVSLALLGQFMAERHVTGSIHDRKETRNSEENDVEAFDFSGIAEREEGWGQARTESGWKHAGGVKELLRRIFPGSGRKYPDFVSGDSLRLAEDETIYHGARETEEGAAEKTAGGAVGREEGETSEWKRDETASEAEPNPGELISQTDGQSLYIRKFPCFLGSDPDFADCVVEEEGISRVHARLVESAGQVWVEDLKSDQGTFVNGDRMVPYEPWVLKNGDEIKLAGSSYRFRRRQ